METLKKIIEKQGELIEYYHNWAIIKSQSDMKAIGKLESELTSLRSQAEQEEKCHVFASKNVTKEPMKGYVCTICHQNPVDAENGYDTCPECLGKM